jgi:hypothetical protein
MFVESGAKPTQYDPLQYDEPKVVVGTNPCAEVIKIDWGSVMDVLKEIPPGHDQRANRWMTSRRPACYDNIFPSAPDTREQRMEEAKLLAKSNLKAAVIDWALAYFDGDANRWMKRALFETQFVTLYAAGDTATLWKRIATLDYRDLPRRTCLEGALGVGIAQIFGGFRATLFEEIVADVARVVGMRPHKFNDNATSLRAVEDALREARRSCCWPRSALEW